MGQQELCWEGHRPDTDSGLAVIFRREGNREATREIALRALDPKRRYDVTFEDMPEKLVIKGGKVVVQIPVAPGSAILYYKRAK